MTTIQIAKPNKNNGVSFNKTAKVKVNVPTQVSADNVAYDASVRYNKVMWPPKRGTEGDSTYSVDALGMIRDLEKDGEKLKRISLVCSGSGMGIALWDVMFNFKKQTGVVYSVFVADKDFNPIPKSRIVTEMTFQDHSYSKVRTHLNHLIPGDKIGIGIFDAAMRKTHVLIYDVAEEAVVRNPKADMPKTSRVLPVVNCDLESISRFDVNGSGNVRHYNDDETAVYPQAFISRIVSSVLDFDTSYPWKPHFTPKAPEAWDRTTIENSLRETLSEYQVIGTYDEFEEACNQLHRDCLTLKKDYLDRDMVTEARAVTLPIAKVITLGEDSVIAVVNNPNNNETSVFRFSQESMKMDGQAETYLCNKDLEGKNLDNMSDILVIKEESFGDNAIVRFMTVNF